MLILRREPVGRRYQGARRRGGAVAGDLVPRAGTHREPGGVAAGGAAAVRPAAGADRPVAAPPLAGAARRRAPSVGRGPSVRCLPRHLPHCQPILCIACHHIRRAVNRACFACHVVRYTVTRVSNTCHIIRHTSMQVDNASSSTLYTESTMSATSFAILYVEWAMTDTSPNTMSNVMRSVIQLSGLLREVKENLRCAPNGAHLTLNTHRISTRPFAWGPQTSSMYRCWRSRRRRNSQRRCTFRNRRTQRSAAAGTRSVSCLLATPSSEYYTVMYSACSPRHPANSVR
jgi:hypothetical protein